MCGCQKPLTEFSRSRRAQDGLCSRCKQCDNARCRRNCARKLERNRATKRCYRAAHAERIQAYHRRYYVEHADRIRVARRRYCENNAEKLAAKQAVTRAVQQGRLPHPSILQCAWCEAQAMDYHHCTPGVAAPRSL